MFKEKRYSKFKLITFIVTLYFHESFSVKKEKGVHYILFWTNPKTKPFNQLERGPTTFTKRKCAFNNCFVVFNKEYLNEITDFDAILFNYVDLKDSTLTLPDKRCSKQRYVFVSTKCASNNMIPSKYQGIFNWTWTYRLDSDINWPRISIRDENGEIIGPKEDMHWKNIEDMKPLSKHIEKKLEKKKIAAAWLGMHNYYHFINKLDEQLFKYGYGLNLFDKCDEKCIELLESDYYFCIAFESLTAKDFVSEKLLTALNHFTVPVVHGGANYTRFMPEGTYLNAENLDPSVLAKKMVDLIQNRTAYHNMFKWHAHYSYHAPADRADSDSICKFCAKLNEPNHMNDHKVYTNVVKWFNDLTDCDVQNHSQLIRTYRSNIKKLYNSKADLHKIYKMTGLYDRKFDKNDPNFYKNYRKMGFKLFDKNNQKLYQNKPTINRNAVKNYRKLYQGEQNRRINYQILAKNRKTINNNQVYKSGRKLGKNCLNQDRNDQNLIEDDFDILKTIRARRIQNYANEYYYPTCKGLITCTFWVLGAFFDVLGGSLSRW